MGNSLESPKTEKDSESYTSYTGLECGGSGMQGWRIEMEDSHIAVNIPSKPDHLFLGVWDGHAGAGAAKYAHDNIINFLEDTDEWKEYLRGGVENHELIGRAMIAAFLAIDVKMKVYQMTTNGHDTSGCTSVTAMVTPKYIICANAGDSRCVMGIGGGGAKPLSFDHKPSLQIERERIDAAGGFVQWNRVDGDLAVSRALGDFGYKNRPDLPPEAQKVSCYPDITVHERQPTDDLLLLACDGLWDVMTSSEAVAQVRELFQTGETEVYKIAEEMLDISLKKGSKDNVSAMLVKLPGAVLGPASNGGIDRLRETRQGYGLNAIDETPAFALSNAPGQFGALSGMNIGGINGMTADQLIAQMMMGTLQGVDMDSLAAMVEEEMAYEEPADTDADADADAEGDAAITEAEVIEDEAKQGGSD